MLLLSEYIKQTKLFKFRGSSYTDKSVQYHKRAALGTYSSFIKKKNSIKL